MLRFLTLLCATLLGLVFGVAAPAGAQEPTPSPPVLDAGFEPLRAGFNRDADHIRLLLLLDPT
ncbi:MAG: hypothetical protein ACRD4T_11025 [Candidatus Acidiferrales bacterium]